MVAGEEAAAAVEGSDQHSEHTLLCVADFQCDLSASKSLALLPKIGIIVGFCCLKRTCKGLSSPWVPAGCRRGHLKLRDEGRMRVKRKKNTFGTGGERRAE